MVTFWRKKSLRGASAENGKLSQLYAVVRRKTTSRSEVSPLWSLNVNGDNGMIIIVVSSAIAAYTAACYC